MKRNLLLGGLEEEDRLALSGHFEQMDLPRGFELSMPRTMARYCYFPTSGIISTVVVSPQGKQAEIGVIGREGMSPSSAVLGSDQNPYRTVIQIAGQAWRVPREVLSGLMEERASLRQTLLRWAHVFSTQIAYTALSHATHPVDARLARWLLMCHDRVESDRLALTHHFLSIMLAVRRPSVTTSLHVLEGHGFIHSQRGLIVIRNRQALENFAADAYGGSEREYGRLLRPPAEAAVVA